MNIGDLAGVFAIVASFVGAVFAYYRHMTVSLEKTNARTDEKYEKLSTKQDSELTKLAAKLDTDRTLLETKIEANRELESRARHALANNMQSLLTKQETENREILRATMRRDEGQAMEARIDARLDKQDARMERMEEKLNELPQAIATINAIAASMNVIPSLRSNR